MALFRGLQRVNAARRARPQLAAYNHSSYSTESSGPGTLTARSLTRPTPLALGEATALCG